MQGLFFAQKQLPKKYIYKCMSITKSQAASLAENFYDDIGSNDKGELRAKETLTVFFLICGELAESAQENLNSNNTNATGNLSKSITVEDPKDNGPIVSVDITMEEYGRYINDGVKGTKSGSGKYAFKYSNPSRKQVARMLLGIRAARKASKNVNSKKTISGNEKKNSTLAEFSHAWGAARKVKQEGIKATGFFNRAIKKAEASVSERLGAAFKIDILNSLNDFEK